MVFVQGRSQLYIRGPHQLHIKMHPPRCHLIPPSGTLSMCSVVGHFVTVLGIDSSFHYQTII
jgi:hypothetical protein